MCIFIKMMQTDITQLDIGLLGGGQLGRMLLQAAINLNLQVSVMDSDAQAPCRTLCKSFTHGDVKDFDAVYRFGKGRDIITIEIEDVNTAALKKLANEGCRVYPDPELIELIQDKGLQKQFYQKHHIPSPDFFIVENRLQIARFKPYFPFFQKLRKGGYDGRGVMALHDAEHIDKAFDAPSVLERMVDIDKELSVIVARNVNGDIQCFPIVECAFDPKAHLVDFLFCPASVKKNMEQQAYRIAEKLAEAFHLVGILAVEFFVSKAGELLVNEVAPRAHNSGHHTIEANAISQFEQQWRAILNLPLGDTRLRTPAVMVNLIGAEGHTGKARYKGLDQVLKFQGVYVHLYGKAETRPFRKMGHVTITDDTLQKAKQKAKIIKSSLSVIN